MLTKQKDELYEIWVVYDEDSNYNDILLPKQRLQRFNFGLPYIEEKLLRHEQYIEFIGHCHKDFIKESVFDNKYLAFKRWQELLNSKVEKINKFLGE